MFAAFLGLSLVLLTPVLYIASYIRSRQRSNSLPPGPKRSPLLGVASSIDPSKPWFSYFQWRKTFGASSLQFRFVSLIWFR